MSKTMKYPHFEKMRSIGQYAAQCLRELEYIIEEGISTQHIDNYVNLYALKHNLGLPQCGYTFDNIHYFPAACCVSVNDEVCHGIPSYDKILKEGDLVKVDVTFTDKDGWHGDTCWTWAVDNAISLNPLTKTTIQALEKGIDAVKIDRPISDIGKAIETYVTPLGYSVVREYCGHSIGQKFHEPPCIPHYYEPECPDSNVILKPGMMFTIEPMINSGSPNVYTSDDGWTVKTRDGSWSAQFEHTLGLDHNGEVVVFTRL